MQAVHLRVGIKRFEVVQHWIFLRGLVRESRHWGSFPTAFRAGIAKAQVLTADLPGNGALHSQKSPLHIEDMLEACRAALGAHGLKAPYHLLALSLGGMVARAWMERYPQEVAAAVLISTSMRPYSPFYRRLRPGNYPALMRVGSGWHQIHAREAAIFRLTSTMQVRRHDEIVSDWTRFATDAPVSRANALRQLCAAARFKAARGGVKAPTLLLSGSQDRLVHPSCSTALARAWGVPCSVHPGAGHDLPLDDPGWVIDQVRRWMAG